MRSAAGHPQDGQELLLICLSPPRDLLTCKLVGVSVESQLLPLRCGDFPLIALRDSQHIVAKPSAEPSSTKRSENKCHAP